MTITINPNIPLMDGAILRHNQTTDGITIVIPPDAVAPATRTNLVDSFEVLAGSFVGFKFVNNASSLIATLGFLAFDVEYD